MFFSYPKCASDSYNNIYDNTYTGLLYFCLSWMILFRTFTYLVELLKSNHFPRTTITIAFATAPIANSALYGRGRHQAISKINVR